VEAHLAALRAGQTLEHEVWNLRKNGDRRLMRLNEKPLALPDGGEGILVVARDITQSKRVELVKEVFLALGAKLSAARTPVEAARAVYAAGDQLWKWDAASLDLYFPESDQVQSVLSCDVVLGQRREVPGTLEARAPSPRMRRIMQQGAEMMLRQSTHLPSTDSIGFGDMDRPTSSKLYVPLRREGKSIGVLSIQSYSPDAYAQEDLRTLQGLADHCAGALERLRVEQALQQGEELNRTILATAMDGIFVIDFSTDLGGAIIEVNEAYCHLVGYSPEELRQMRIADLEATENLEEVGRHKARIMATGIDRFETRHRRKDGQEIQVEISVSKLAGSTERVFGFVRDITERKRAEMAKEAFLTLGTKLNVAKTAREAAKAIFASADLLWKWHCGTLHLSLPEADRAQAVLNYDIVGGQRREVPGQLETGEPTPRMHRIMRNGPELILREPHCPPEDGTQMIGDTSRPSQSIMCVPLRREGQAVGVLSIQSYTPNAYRREDLLTLQALADHCGGALQRIQAETALREEHEKLEQRVRERTAELRTANAALHEVSGHLEQRVHERTAELQAANAALAESEERYRSLVNNLNVGVFRTTPGPHGRIIQVNPATAHIYGYDSVEQFQKVRVADLYQEPGERELFVADLLRQGAVVNYEVRLKKIDGTPIYGRINATLHRGPNGEVDWIDGMIEDITERKQAEQDLAEALELNRTLISASTVGIAAYKASGQCVIANGALARITGGTTEQLLQQDFRQLPSWRTDGLLAKAEAALETLQPQELETQSRTTFGRALVINARFSSFTSQGEQHLLLMVTDETEAQQAQEALRVSEERYRTLAESSPDAIFILDREIKVRYVNSTAAALWGRKPEDLIGMKQSELLPPQTAAQHTAIVAEVFRTGKPLRRDEPLAFPVGEQWIEIRLAPLYGEQGTVTSVMGVCRDITERKRAERQLAEALDLNEKMIATSTMGFAAYRATGECVFANQAIAKIVGGSVSAVLQGNFRRLQSWQKSGLLRLAEEALNQGQARSGEVYTTTRFGKSVWLDCHTAPFVSNGQPHLLVMALDISERKRTEEALKLQSLVVQNMAEAALLVGPDQTILFANTALETSFGYAPGELIGQPLALLNDWSAEETARFNADVMRAVKRGEPWFGEYQNRRKDGTHFTSESRIRVLDLGGRPHFVSVQQDITERKRVEGALKQAERLQRAILDNIPDPAWLKDAEGRYLACNQAIAQFYGLPAESFLGKTLLDCVPTEGARSAREDKEVMTTRRSVVAELPLTDAQGRMRWLESIKSPLFNERDEVIGTVGIARDVTERHRLERQILEISDLEQARIGQDMHDGLCQQLVSLAFDANLLQSELSAHRRPEAKKARRIAEFLDQAITETRQLSRGLFVVRLEKEGLPLALEELARANSARFKIHCRFQSQGPAAVKNIAVATHLYRIAQEGVTNAIKHSRAGNVSIRLKAGDSQIELKVEDDEAGLSPAKQKKAAGLGLHIMGYRARAIGGTLDIGPGRQGGTIVSCCVPLPKTKE
jgi:PAS domain S-box-containing protein